MVNYEVASNIHQPPPPLLPYLLNGACEVPALCRHRSGQFGVLLSVRANPAHYRSLNENSRPPIALDTLTLQSPWTTIVHDRMFHYMRRYVVDLLGWIIVVVDFC